MKWLGNQLKNAIKQAQKTQESFANDINVSRVTVNAWIKGQVPRGIELMKICRNLGMSPDLFFEDDVAFSCPRHRPKAHAKITESRQHLAEQMITSFHDVFRGNFSNMLTPSLSYTRDSDPARLAKELRECSGLVGDGPLRLQDVFNLAKYLGIFIVPIPFDPELKSSALYTFIDHHNKVIFIDNKTFLLDMVYFILHEICHAIINNTSNDYDDKEEEFCEKTAGLAQYSDCYIQKIYSMIKLKGRYKGVVVNLLKEYSVKNHHSLFGIAKAIDIMYGTEWGGIVAPATTKMKKENQASNNLESLLLSQDNPHDFLRRFKSISPLYLDQVILKKYKSVTDRRLSELFGLANVLDGNDMRKELERYEDAIQTGCPY